MDCQLTYIPDHLHTNGRPIINVFKVGEELYYRCYPHNIKKPYDKISLYDISHNRNFSDTNTFKQADVLFNVIEDDLLEIYENLEVIILKIQDIKGNSTFKKEIISQIDPQIVGTIELKHDPIPCMYPHSVFQITLNGTVVDRFNYSKTLGKSSRLFKNLRSDIRQELTSIIQTGSIDSSKDIEFLDKP